MPLVVVGALRAGGSGKTSVTIELARALSVSGCRPALLAYGLGSTTGSDCVREVRAGDDWRQSSEEALLLRGETGCRVFVTRDRAAAWRRLEDRDIQADGPFDILISDDGFQDPRLNGALRLLLIAPGERPGLFDLLPAGPFRETWSARLGADILLRGPFPARVTCKIPGEDRDPDRDPDWESPAQETNLHSGPPVHSFGRRLLAPPGLDRDRPWIAYCALGDNRPFLRGLEEAGIRPVAVVEGRNHAAPSLPRLRECAGRHPGAGVLCTRKDYLKLGPAMAAGLEIIPIDQRILLGPETVAAVAAYRLAFRSRYLVHYPA